MITYIEILEDYYDNSGLMVSAGRTTCIFGVRYCNQEESPLVCEYQVVSDSDEGFVWIPYGHTRAVDTIKE